MCVLFLFFLEYIVNWFIRLVYRACFAEEMRRKWKKKRTEKQTTDRERFVANFRESETRRKKDRGGRFWVRYTAVYRRAYIAAMLSANTRVRPIYPKGWGRRGPARWWVWGSLVQRNEFSTHSPCAVEPPLLPLSPTISNHRATSPPFDHDSPSRPLSRSVKVASDGKNARQEKRDV